MLRLTLAQMRRSLTRLTAAAIAITIGTAFLAATLLAGGVMTRTGYDAVTASYGHADLVVKGDLDAGALARLRGTAEIKAIDPLAVVGVGMTAGQETRWVNVLATPSDAALGSLEVTQGRAPQAAGELALPTRVANALRVGVGDTVKVEVPPAPDATDGSGAKPAPSGGTGADPDAAHQASARVVGIVSDPAGAWSQIGGAALATPGDAVRWGGVSSLTQQTRTYLVMRAHGASDDDIRAAVHAATSADTRVLTRDAAATESIENNTGDGHVLVAIVLGFAAIALLVAALVIANTFQVLVAQRTRTLALLRCVGAGRTQLRTSVLLEAGLLGAGASAVGIVTGVALAQGALVGLRHAQLDVPLPTTVHVTPAVVLVPLLVGTVVTLLASLVPAQAATRVSPIAALRPAEAPVAPLRSGGTRLWLAAVLAIGGALGLLGAVAMGHALAGSTLLALALGVVSGAASFVGVLLGAVYWVPRCVALVGLAVQRSGVAARLAVANTARNPRRTAATSTALLIGVTLVAMMATGAASARASTDKQLDEQYPVDVAASSDTPLPADAAQVVGALGGVRDVVAMRGANVGIGGNTVRVYAPADAGADVGDVVRDASIARQLADGSIVLPRQAGGTEGDQPVVLLDPDTGEPAAGAPARTLAVHPSGLGGFDGLTTRATLAQVAPDAATTALWIRLAAGADPSDVQDALESALPSVTLDVRSGAADRIRYANVIDTLLAIVVGLLAVAVLIALVGVANTLSLSVLERRRESATLRAIGLTRGRLRWTLGIEGMLIAGVGAVLGVALGLVYGWAGAAVVLGNTGDLTLAVPWQRLGSAVLVAVVAGLLASVLPARSAVRTPPVAALAVE
ncbi:ABC transporter permease [Cellulomonas alba]|uniref:FtsX-like permease family protein n=1 Tax=Cellulomonas alba TaxID=3053467 RepID=A0ABT7SER2_9CELL|nr:FtsX-like permease family protein [Cellulomonas alba]MDM7854057.1 FtsX-like permease family protein [Cellulomonas alba]